VSCSRQDGTNTSLPKVKKHVPFSSVCAAICTHLNIPAASVTFMIEGVLIPPTATTPMGEFWREDHEGDGIDSLVKVDMMIHQTGGGALLT